MIQLSDEVVIILISGTICSMILVRTLNCLVKSRCSRIKTCCGECEREVISERNISKDIIREIEIPKNLVTLKN